MLSLLPAPFSSTYPVEEEREAGGRPEEVEEGKKKDIDLFKVAEAREPVSWPPFQPES